MFISEAAKILLLKNDSTSLMTLQTMPLNTLLSASSYEEYKKACEDPLNAYRDVSASAYSCPLNLVDNIVFDTIKDAVVITSGHIFSQSTVSSLRGACPYTRIPITHQVRLPVVDEAINQFRSLRDAARKDEKREEKKADEKSTAADFTLSIHVSGNKYRLHLNGAQVAALCNHLEKAAKVADHVAYAVASWGRAYRLSKNSLQLEFWFPQGELSDEQYQQLFTDTLAALKLPNEPVTVSVPERSPSKLGPRQYATLLARLNISHEQAENCCVSFMRDTAKLNSLVGTRDRYTSNDSRPLMFKSHIGPITISSASAAAPEYHSSLPRSSSSQSSIGF